MARRQGPWCRENTSQHQPWRRAHWSRIGTVHAGCLSGGDLAASSEPWILALSIYTRRAVGTATPVLPVLAVLCFGRRPSHTGCRVAACARHPQRPSARSLWSAPRLLLPWAALRPRTAGSCHCGGAGRGAALPGDGWLGAVHAPEEARRSQGRGVLAAPIAVAGHRVVGRARVVAGSRPTPWQFLCLLDSLDLRSNNYFIFFLFRYNFGL